MKLQQDWDTSTGQEGGRITNLLAPGQWSSLE